MEQDLRPVEHDEASPAAEDAIKAGAQFDPAPVGSLLPIGLEAGVEPPDQPAQPLLHGVLVVGEGVEPG